MIKKAMVEDTNNLKMIKKAMVDDKKKATQTNGSNLKNDHDNLIKKYFFIRRQLMYLNFQPIEYEKTKK
jgi:hypothetical protein